MQILTLEVVNIIIRPPNQCTYIQKLSGITKHFIFKQESDLIRTKRCVINGQRSRGAKLTNSPP